MASLTLRATRPDIDEEFYRIVDELTRRRFLAGGLAAVTAVGLGACASNNVSSEASSPSERQVETVHGTVTIPAVPKRIASLDYYVNETLWDISAAGVIGVPYYVGGAPRYAKKYAALHKTSNTAGLDLEAIAKLNPDMIISLQYPYIDDAYDKLSAIAPTVVLPFKTWDVNAAAVADALGLGARLGGLKKQYANRVTQLKAGHRELLARYRFDVLDGGVGGGQFWVMGAKSVITPLLKDAGVRFASPTSTTTGAYQAVSYEDLSALQDADAIIYWSKFGGTVPAGSGPELFAQPLWKTLPAVKAGRLMPIADFAVGGYGDALAALDELDTGLTALEKKQ